MDIRAEVETPMEHAEASHHKKTGSLRSQGVNRVISQQQEAPMKTYRYHLPTEERRKLQRLERLEVDQIARRRANRAERLRRRQEEDKSALREALRKLLVHP
ncbi:MAG: hypothetical protein OJF50_006418 [Nitrospira sp.]|nr:hypothetical protein [Nitrospira sp.]